MLKVTKSKYVECVLGALNTPIHLQYYCALEVTLSQKVKIYYCSLTIVLEFAIS